jgi:hypothetical protein
LDNQADGLISGGYSGLYNYGSIIALSNEGTITGGSGIDTTHGEIGTLTNSGLINGTNGQGIFNIKGMIGLLDNSGTILAADAGVSNLGSSSSGTLHPGVISTLSNTGQISGSQYGVDNSDDQAIIGTLNNVGTLAVISGGTDGILNVGTIGVLRNAGTISGDDSGIYTSGTINILDNSGTILGLNAVIAAGNIGTIDNAGLISGTATGIAMYSAPVIGALINSGTITGEDYGVYTRAFVGTLDNAGLISGVSQALRIEDAGIGTLSNTGTIMSGAQGVEMGAPITLFANAGLIRGANTALRDDGATIGILSNDGAMNGVGFAGIENSGGDVGRAENSGTITGGQYGVANTGYTIESDISNAAFAALSNSGTIYGGVAGLINTTLASIGSLDNTGASALITGPVYGVWNQGTMGAFMNEGAIEGTDPSGTHPPGATNAGLFNDLGASIGVLANEATGLIMSGSSGVINAGSIGVLSNAGTISGARYGVNDTLGSIGSFENSGLITGGTIAGVIMASGSMENSGTIAGPTGVILTGDNASIFDAGTIASTNGGDAILFEAADPDSLTLTTGADILGAIDGGTTAGTIKLEGTGTLAADIVNFTAGSALDVVSGAHWSGAGNWTIATLTNDGAFQGGLIGNALTLTGDFVQAPNSTLLVAVSPQGESQFVVDGTAALAGGLTYRFAPGTYRAGTYKFLTVSGGITGGFADVAYEGKVPAAFTHATVQDASTGNLVLTAIPVVPGAKPAAVVAPADDAVFADANEAAALSAQAANDSLLGKAAERAGAAADSASCGAEAAGVRATGDGPGVSGQGRAAAAIGQAFCAAGGWVQATGGVATMDGGGGVAGFSTNMAGFLAGVDAPMGAGGSRVGLAVGYDEDWLKDGEGGKASVGTARFGVFGSQALGHVVLASDFMLGTMSEDMTRQAGPRGATAKPGGTVYEGGVQAGTAVQLNGFSVAPAVGLRAAVVDVGGFAERAPAPFGAFAVRAAAGTYASVQPYAKVTVSRTYLTGGGVSVTPDASVGYAAELADRGQAVGVTAADGTAFVSSKTAPDGNAAEFSAGVSAGQGGWSLYAKYAAAVSGNWTAQSGEAGVAARF